MIGERLRQLRKSKGMSQRQLAAAIGTTGQQIGRYEKETNNGGEESLLKLARFFGVSPAYLSGKSPSPDRNNNVALEWEGTFRIAEDYGMGPAEVDEAIRIYRAVKEAQKREG